MPTHSLHPFTTLITPVPSAGCLVDSCGIVTGLDTYNNITAGISQNTAEQPSLLVQGEPYCATSASNAPVNGGTYMQQYQWRQCLCTITGIGASTLKDGTYASICNSQSPRRSRRRLGCVID